MTDALAATPRRRRVAQTAPADHARDRASMVARAARGARHPRSGAACARSVRWSATSSSTATSPTATTPCRSARARPSRQPYVVARMTAAARPTEGWRDAGRSRSGTGSGYQAAILASWARGVEHRAPRRLAARRARPPRGRGLRRSCRRSWSATARRVAAPGAPYRSILVTAGGLGPARRCSSSSIRTAAGWSCRSATASTSC